MPLTWKDHNCEFPIKGLTHSKASNLEKVQLGNVNKIFSSHISVDSLKASQGSLMIDLPFPGRS